MKVTAYSQSISNRLFPAIAANLGTNRRAVINQNPRTEGALWPTRTVPLPAVLSDLPADCGVAVSTIGEPCPGGIEGRRIQPRKNIGQLNTYVTWYPDPTRENADTAQTFPRERRPGMA